MMEPEFPWFLAGGLWTPASSVRVTTGGLLPLLFDRCLSWRFGLVVGIAWRVDPALDRSCEFWRRSSCTPVVYPVADVNGSDSTIDPRWTSEPVLVYTSEMAPVLPSPA